MKREKRRRNKSAWYALKSLEKKRKYEEDLRNRTGDEGEKIEFTPAQLHEIVKNTPEGQRLLQVCKKGDLKRKPVVCLVKTVGLPPWVEKVDEDFGRHGGFMLVVGKVLKLPCILQSLPNQNRHYF